MASTSYTKKTWVGRLGVGLNKYRIGAADLNGRQTITSDPETVTQEGDAVSADNLNAFEGRIDQAFETLEGNLSTEATTRAQDDSALETEINKIKNGTTVVEKAKKDEDGNNIKNTYATKTALESTDEALTNMGRVIGQTLNQHDSRLQNLEQKAGDYSIVQYRGTNAVPTGKAKYGLVKSIVGKTRAWNQLVQNGNFASGDGWVLESGVTASFSGNVATISSTTSSNGIRREIDFINGHKYLVSAEINTESALDVKFGSSSSGGAQVQITTSVFNRFVKYSEIKTASADSYQFYIFVSGTYSNLKVRNVTLYDLTLIFGAGNEPSTVADALAQLPSLGQYNAYDAGSLVSTEVSGVKSVGINLFDKDGTFVDAYCDGSGVFYGNYGTLNAKSVIIKVKSGQTYYFNTGNKNGGMHRCAFTREYPTIGDRIYNASGTNTYETYTNGSTVTVPTGFMYMIVTFFRSDVSNDGYDNVRNALCINVSDISINGQYYPYMTDTLPLPETVTLRSAGNVADELDVESGVVTREVSEYTITGQEGLIETGGNQWIFQQFPNTAKLPASNGVTGDILCDFAVNSSYNDVNIAGKTGMIALRDNGWLLVTTDIKNNWANLIGKKILFGLKEPTTESIDPVPYNFLEVEGGGTIDTIQDQTPVIDNCLDIGYLAV